MKGMTMKNISKNNFLKSKITGNIIILMAASILLYLLASIYFSKHFFFNTSLNGVDVSLKAYKDADNLTRGYVNAYKLQLIEREGEFEVINGQDIEMQYNEQNSTYKIINEKKSLQWIISLFKDYNYFVEDLYSYNEDKLEDKISQLNCLNKTKVAPQNASFKYSNGSYEVIKEVYGNKINQNNLRAAIKMSILKGETKVDLNETFCYENPEYILSSEKTLETKNLLERYVKANITYIFDSENEILDGSTINNWLSVDENLNVVISEIAVMKYIKELSSKYDTVGITRDFKTSTGKIVEVKGGLYGWKINRDAEVKALIENIKKGEVLIKEPIYNQKALPRGKGEIGNTYVEINITRQHLWFYKNGRIITQGSVVTGKPVKGRATVLGTYMLNYKQKGATLVGHDYEAPVTYWMPFFGNIGIHDASWRYSFGGDIYKTNGSHGCVNSPLYLAKTIFENIEEGTPIICYEE
jgi:lipoprotein-anchoring transpeptidase ErfK/SrfK